MIDKLQQLATAAANAAALLASPDQAAQRLGRQILADLETYRVVEVEPLLVTLRAKAAEMRTAAAEEQKKTAGRAAWAELHRRYVSANGAVDTAAEATWLRGWISKVPCGECRTEWADVLRRHPFDAKRPFEWSVTVHNAINAKLGKPQVAIEAARKEWAGK